MTAVEMKSGNFAVMTDKTAAGPVSVIVKTDMGWRVLTRTAARGNSRTYSRTPEQAASKYFRHKVAFVRENSLGYLPSEFKGVKELA